MRGWQGFALGFLGLTLLEITVSNQGANSRVGGILSGVGTFFQKFLDPTKPAFTPIASTAAATSGPGGSSVSSVSVPVSIGGQSGVSGGAPLPGNPAANPNPGVTPLPSTTPGQAQSLQSGQTFLS